MALYNERNNAIINVLRKNKIKSVLDLGCGDGKLLKQLYLNEEFELLGGVDISQRRINKLRSYFENNKKVQLFEQSFFIINESYFNYEGFVLSEVIEHLPLKKTYELIDFILEYYVPNIIIITTPNRSYNTNYQVLHSGLRHISHIFELSDNDARTFTEKISKKHSFYIITHGYSDPSHASHMFRLKKRSNNNEKS